MPLSKENDHINKTVLILGANSDVAKAVIILYVKNGHSVIAASRSTGELNMFIESNGFANNVTVQYFDATAFDTHQQFYNNLPYKPNIVLYAAGFLKENKAAMLDWESSFPMMTVHYCGAVFIINIIVADKIQYRA